jgi:hypothetical protein
MEVICASCPGATSSASSSRRRSADSKVAGEPGRLTMLTSSGVWSVGQVESSSVGDGSVDEETGGSIVIRGRFTESLRSPVLEKGVSGGASEEKTVASGERAGDFMSPSVGDLRETLG